MYYWLHILWIYLGSRLFWSRVSPADELVRSRKANVLDCDAFRYMANSRYFYYMDLIRYEILFRSVLYDHTVKKGMFGVLASQKIIYFKPIRRGSRFTISLTLEGSDHKWVYHRQTFCQNGIVCAVGFTKAGFWKNKRAQDMRAIFRNCGIQEHLRKPRAEVADLFKSDREILKNSPVFPH